MTFNIFTVDITVKVVVSGRVWISTRNTCSVFSFFIEWIIRQKQKRQLGSLETPVSANCLGCWGMSDAYGQADCTESIETINMAIDMRISLLDTADVYGSGDNERLIAEAIRGKRSQVIIATKFGFIGDDHGKLTVCGKPEYVKKACEASLKRLINFRGDRDWAHAFFIWCIAGNVQFFEIGRTVPLPHCICYLLAKRLRSIEVGSIRPARRNWLV